MKTTVALLSCIVLLCNCRKDPLAPAAEAEDSQQKLVKIINTLIINDNLLSSDSINFAYDDAGKIIAEGKLRYYRDDKERVIRITQPLWGVDDYSSYVFYADEQSGKVAYVAYGASILGYTDSVAYFHDSQGRVNKIMDYYFFDDRDSFVLINYVLFDYDEKSNLKQITKYALDYDNFILCYRNMYTEYDDQKNPLHSDDEVRLFEYFWGFANVSANNVRFTAHNNYHEQYDYRADGRPRSCSITQNGKEQYRSNYYYK
ncbi:MAG TPA: hypothetical protein PLA68_03125 [Panacibacter sp.]|nr:hypothetical protein [Panacibacter sp.]